MTEIYIDYSRYALEAASSSNEDMSSDSRASNSDNMAETSYPEGYNGDVKATVTAGEVKQLLDRRIKALEEEAEFSEQAVLEGLEERKKLMDEIYMRLQLIRRSLSLDKQETENDSSQGALIINPLKPKKQERTSTGISQVLDQELNQAQLVARDVKVNTKAFQLYYQLFHNSSTGR